MKKSILNKTAAIGAILATGLAIAAAAIASVPNSFDRLYYSDATLTNEVGMETQYCDGHRYIWYGGRTPYFVDVNLESCSLDPND